VNATSFGQLWEQLVMVDWNVEWDASKTTEEVELRWNKN
jgi:hypothetical protein